MVISNQFLGKEITISNQIEQWEVVDIILQGWYYLKSDGSYARNTWIGSYLKANGRWLKVNGFMIHHTKPGII